MHENIVASTTRVHDSDLYEGSLITIDVLLANCHFVSKTAATAQHKSRETKLILKVKSDKTQLTVEGMGLISIG